MIVHASDASADVYKVLGVLPTTPSDRIMAAYNKLTRAAKSIGDSESVAKYEAAYNAVLMENMKKRLSGNMKEEDISGAKFADQRCGDIRGRSVRQWVSGRISGRVSGSVGQGAGPGRPCPMWVTLL
jgi:hypothetical protein